MREPENKFCVYLHRRETDGSVFYVGKGTIKRSKAFYARSDWWHRVKDKHGCVVETVKEFMPECCSYTLEKITIAKFRSLGHPLVNITDGGEGAVGAGLTVYSSCGNVFKSALDAANWLRLNGYPKACHSGIYKCCYGKKNSAYGRMWSTDGVPDAPQYYGRAANSNAIKKSISRRIKTYCGMEFETMNDAVSFLKSIGHEKARSSSLTNAARGRTKTAYGYKWGYADGKT